jgi:hypothetical protein
MTDLHSRLKRAERDVKRRKWKPRPLGSLTDDQLAELIEPGATARDLDRETLLAVIRHSYPDLPAEPSYDQLQAIADGRDPFAAPAGPADPEDNTVSTEPTR